MKKTIFLLILLCSTVWAYSQEVFTTIPQVQHWESSHKIVDYKSVTIKYSKALKREQKILINRFEQELKEIGVNIQKRPSKSTLDLFFDSKYVNIDKKQNAYKIQLSKKTTVSAASYKGLVFATRTLLQLFFQEKYKNNLPSGLVVDYPSYEKRMLLIDVARKFFTINELKDFIRAMAWVKMNELHLHLSDNSWGGYSAYRLESAKYPNLTAKDGHYSWKEIRDLQDFATSYGISIVPEIDSPGHSMAFTNIRPDLKSKWLDSRYLDITNKEMYPFIEEILDEVIPHFDAPDFHIGTDEYRIRNIKNDSLKTVIGETFRKYINHFNKVVRKHGKTTRIWSGFEHMPGNTKIDKSIVIDMWETSDAKDKSSKGYKMINSSHFYTYIVPGAPYYGVNDRFVYEEWTPEIFSNVKAQNLEKDSPGLLGSKMHIWTDFGPTGYSIEEIARLSIPTMMVFSEKMWGTKAFNTLAKFNNVRRNLMQIPQTTILNRNFSKETVSYASKKEIDLKENSFLKIKSEKQNVEYPWKLELTLNRSGKPLANEVLLSSRLATVYAQIEHTFKVKKNKKQVEETKKGFGIVRANQTEGVTPLKSHNPDILIFDYELPINQSVQITLVGEKKKTSMYANGKLIGVKNIQTVCPTQYIGSKKEAVFNGEIEKIEIKELAAKK